MESHPGRDKLELLQQGKLRGSELLEILRHLETCDECFQNLPPQDPTEVVIRLLTNEDNETDDIVEDLKTDE
jgi:hypothetical protein